MLPDLKIKVTQTGPDGKERDTTEKHKLDICHIRVNPAWNKEAEYFSSPAALISSLSLDFEHDHEGLVLKGYQQVKSYQAILEQIHYFNLRPEQYPKRIFLVQCSMLNGRVLSNQLTVSMAIEEVIATTEKTKEVQKEKKEKATETQNEERRVQNARLKATLRADAPKPNLGGPLPLLHDAGYEASSSKDGVMASGAVAIVVVVCIGFLLVVIVVGILRMKGVRRRSPKRGRARSDEGLVWDDSGMNITVNPVADEEAPETGPLNEEDFTDEDDSSDDGDSYRDEEEDELTEDDEEELESVLPHRSGGGGLEWDDSTLRPPLSAHRTYRV
jgi:hypothetical protein